MGEEVLISVSDGGGGIITKQQCLLLITELLPPPLSKDKQRGTQHNFTNYPHCKYTLSICDFKYNYDSRNAIL